METAFGEKIGWNSEKFISFSREKKNRKQIVPSREKRKRIFIYLHEILNFEGKRELFIFDSSCFSLSLSLSLSSSLLLSIAGEFSNFSPLLPPVICLLLLLSCFLPKFATWNFKTNSIFQYFVFVSGLFFPLNNSVSLSLLSLLRFIFLNISVTRNEFGSDRNARNDNWMHQSWRWTNRVALLVWDWWQTWQYHPNLQRSSMSTKVRIIHKSETESNDRTSKWPEMSSAHLFHLYPTDGDRTPLTAVFWFSSSFSHRDGQDFWPQTDHKNDTNLRVFLSRWKVSEFGRCSKTCGGGIQTRNVVCIHEITRGSENTIQVRPEMCPIPVPPSKRSCNTHACPIKWVTGDWSDCTSNCGSGLQTRIIKCVQEDHDGRSVTVANEVCDGLKRPEDTQICVGNKVCANRPMLPVVPTMNGPTGVNQRLKPQSNYRDKNSLIVSSPDTVYTQDSPLKRLSIKIGGKAVVFEGTNLKIRCPRKKSAMDNVLFPVTWFKDNRPIKYSHLVGLTAKQSLRIKKIKLTDAGIYKCSVGASSATLAISVKSDPGLITGNRRQTGVGAPKSKSNRDKNNPIGGLNTDNNHVPSNHIRSNDWFKIYNTSEFDGNNLNPVNVRPRGSDSKFFDNKFVSDESQSGKN